MKENKILTEISIPNNKIIGNGFYTPRVMTG